MNDILYELQKVIRTFNDNIEDDPDINPDFIKEGHIEVVTHDNILFELDVKQLEDGSIEKSISVSKLGDNGEVVEVYEGDQDELSELIPNSKLLNYYERYKSKRYCYYRWRNLWVDGRTIFTKKRRI